MSTVAESAVEQPTVVLSAVRESSAGEFGVEESSPEDLATLRYLLDLALQPIDKFDGFTHLEQIGGTALRYQLNYSCYAMSVSQLTRTPAFTGYLAEAQANMIRKMCDRRVWGYWATERLVGYLRWNPDPMVFANIMYTGFFAAMLAFYETMNDDRGFDDDGSLPLVWNRRLRYDYGFTKIVEAIERNMRDSDQTMYPCEPHLVYPMCNAIALAGMRGYDRLHGTDYTSDLADKIRDTLNRRYLTEDGRYLFGRGPLGVVIPPMVANDAVVAYWLSCVMPDMAETAWKTLRDNRISLQDGRAELLTQPIDHLDVGSYRMGDAWAWVNAACAAAEMGDAEAVEALQSTIANRFTFEYSPSGARKLAGVSVWANCAFAFSRFITAGSLRRLANGKLPAEWKTGPILAAAAYPQVLVAKAVTDGHGLDLVLRPGAGPTRTTLQIARLTPGRTYRVSGAEVDELTAPPSGEAYLNVDLADRCEVRLTPA
jgi:hypothetical protein